jgi:tRNA pseudouridine38-40 synthase
VQAVLEDAISAVTQHRPRVLGSGRTDAGAHATRQVTAFSTTSSLPSETLARAINAHLPADIAVTEACDVSPDFHPRFDASARTYCYVIWNRKVRSPFFYKRAAHVAFSLDETSMDEAAQLLVGRHNMGAFVPVQTSGTREREIFRAGCSRHGDVVIVRIEGTGFMRQMVRAIAGTLIRVGGGRMSKAEFGEVLTSESRNRAAATAPACGLYLVNVRYGSGSLRENSDCIPLPLTFEEKR